MSDADYKTPYPTRPEVLSWQVWEFDIYGCPEPIAAFMFERDALEFATKAERALLARYVVQFDLCEGCDACEENPDLTQCVRGDWQ